MWSGLLCARERWTVPEEKQEHVLESLGAGPLPAAGSGSMARAKQAHSRGHKEEVGTGQGGNRLLDPFSKFNGQGMRGIAMNWKFLAGGNSHTVLKM